MKASLQAQPQGARSRRIGFALVLLALVVLSVVWRSRVTEKKGEASPQGPLAPATGIPPAPARPALASPDAPAPPPPAPQGRVASSSDPRAPFRTLVSLQYWAFAPTNNLCAFRTVLQANRDNHSAVQSIAMPSYREVGERNLHCSANAKVVAIGRTTTTQGYASIAPVLLPLQPVHTDERLTLDVAWTETRLPYLHDDQPGPARLLSLSQGPTTDQAHTVLSFAIPDTCTNLRTTDLQPTRTRTLPGWKLFVYDISGLEHSTIHLAFNFGNPERPAPSPETIFRLEP